MEGGHGFAIFKTWSITFIRFFIFLKCLEDHKSYSCNWLLYYVDKVKWKILQFIFCNCILWKKYFFFIWKCCILERKWFLQLTKKKYFVVEWKEACFAIFIRVKMSSISGGNFPLKRTNFFFVGKVFCPMSSGGNVWINKPPYIHVFTTRSSSTQKKIVSN